MNRMDYKEHQHRPLTHPPYGIVRKEGRTYQRKSLSVHWHPSVLQRQRQKRRWQIFTALALLLFFSSFTIVIYKLLGCDLGTGDCVNLYNAQSASSPESFHDRDGQSQHQKQPMLEEILADVDSPYVDADLYPADVTPSYTDQALDPQRYSVDNHEEQIDDQRPVEHSDLSALEEDEEEGEGEQAEEEEDLHRQQQDEGNAKASDNEDALGYEEEEEDDGGVIDVEPEDEESLVVENDISLGSETMDSMTATSDQIHRHLLNTGSSSEADIWNEGQDLLTDEDFIELDEDYAAISAQNAPQEDTPAMTMEMLPDAQQQSAQGSQSTGAPSISAKLDPGTNYLTFLPNGGITNQFYAMLRALALAKALDRTLIVPPITASSHDMSGQQQPWSTFFDIGTFTLLTNTKIVELHDLKDPSISEARSSPMEPREGSVEEADGAMIQNANQLPLPSGQEPLPCLITGGVGSKRPLDVTAKEFLRQWRFDLNTEPFEHSEELDMKRLVASIKENEPFYHQRWMDNENGTLSTMPSQILCITSAYKISVPKGLEWDQYGRHFYFSPMLERFYVAAMERLREDFELDKQPGDGQQDQTPQDYQPQPPSGTGLEAMTDDRFQDTRNGLYATQPISFISIHARRGDFIEYCKKHFSTDKIHTCLPSTEHLAATLSRLQTRNPSFRQLPVLVSTNESRPEELAKFQRLGWHVVDHAHLQSEETLGGVFGPMMVDQMLMARAKLFIGVRASTFSRVGALRQIDWYNRRAFIL